MAFLDNSGDIILDAVLTKAGRKAMAEGTFNVSKFGCGDDEINYGTYDLAHPSGSAYYDLEIMQTPVFEASTAVTAEINYGLISFNNAELLYLPAFAVNEKSAMVDEAYSTRSKYGVFHMAVNAETAEKLQAEVDAGTGLLNARFFCQAGVSNKARGLIIESGLDTQLKAASSTNRNTLLSATGLIDTTLTFDLDSKFFTGLGVNTGQLGRNDDGGINNTLEISNYDATVPAGTGNLTGFTRYTATPRANLIYEDASGIDDDSLSAIRGPRGICMLVNFSLNEELVTTASGVRARMWTDYGRTAKKIDSTDASPTGTNLYDLLDTTVMVQGNQSGATLQIPVRLVRYVSAA